MSSSTKEFRYSSFTKCSFTSYRLPFLFRRFQSGIVSFVTGGFNPVSLRPRQTVCLSARPRGGVGVECVSTDPVLLGRDSGILLHGLLKIPGGCVQPKARLSRHIRLQHTLAC